MLLVITAILNRPLAMTVTALVIWGVFELLTVLKAKVPGSGPLAVLSSVMLLLGLLATGYAMRSYVLAGWGTSPGALLVLFLAPIPVIWLVRAAVSYLFELVDGAIRL